MTTRYKCHINQIVENGEIVFDDLHITIRPAKDGSANAFATKAVTFDVDTDEEVDVPTGEAIKEWSTPLHKNNAKLNSEGLVMVLLNGAWMRLLWKDSEGFKGLAVE